ncbi:MAG: hypothetical protein NTU44_07560 [Bacteroidetes bacterium]|nr:hypothetical protein [Bacteroidota bacterium]
MPEIWSIPGKAFVFKVERLFNISGFTLRPGGLVAAFRLRQALPSFVGIPIRCRSPGPHQPRSVSGYWNGNIFKNLFLTLCLGRIASNTFT